MLLLEKAALVTGVSEGIVEVLALAAGPVSWSLLARFILLVVPSGLLLLELLFVLRSLGLLCNSFFFA